MRRCNVQDLRYRQLQSPYILESQLYEQNQVIDIVQEHTDNLYYTNRNPMPQRFDNPTTNSAAGEEKVDVKLHLYGRINYLWREYCTD